MYVIEKNGERVKLYREGGCQPEEFVDGIGWCVADWSGRKLLAFLKPVLQLANEVVANVEN